MNLYLISYITLATIFEEQTTSYLMRIDSFENNKKLLEEAFESASGEGYKDKLGFTYDEPKWLNEQHTELQVKCHKPGFSQIEVYSIHSDLDNNIYHNNSSLL